MKPKPHRRRSPVGSKKVALPRYRREQWVRWLQTVDDRETWQATYEAWACESEALADRLSRAGLEVIWIDLDAEEFQKWCESRGYANDTEARNRYAAEQIGNIPPQPASGERQ